MPLNQRDFTNEIGWLKIKKMSEYLTTREVAALLRIKERKVYDLAASGQVPCSKAMGKLLFPRADIEAWLAAGQGNADNRATASRMRPNVVLGSHDPLLEWALRESRSGLATYFDGSSDGMQRFADGEGIAAGLHLFESMDRSWNTTQVAARFEEQPVVLIEWAKRRRGLIVREGHAGEIASLEDVRGLRFAARQEEAGAQQLFDVLVTEAGLEPRDMEVTAVMRSETDAATAVLEGKADVCFGLQSLADQYRLPFVPIIEERFDLLADRRAWFEPAMQALLRFCRSPAFAERAREFAGYDVSGFGTVHFNGSR